MVNNILEFHVNRLHQGMLVLRNGYSGANAEEIQISDN